MVSATIMAPRMLPRKRNRMIETRIMPSLKLSSTVLTVYLHEVERSRKGTTFTPLGRMLVFSFSTSSDPCSTGSESSPFCSSTAFDGVGIVDDCAVRMVRRLCRFGPDEFWDPARPSPMSRTRMGAPLAVLTTVFSMS